MTSNYNVITHNYKVITPHHPLLFSQCNYKIITFLICNYIIITSFSAAAFSFDTPLTDGTLIYGRVDPQENIFIEESYLNIGKNNKNLFQIPTTSDGRFMFGIPQDTSYITLTIKTPTHSETKTFSVSPHKWDEEYITGLSQKKVSLSATDSDRTTTEALQMRQARTISNYPNFSTSWLNPVPTYTPISSQFGSRRILNNIKKQGHSGVDLAAPIGTPVIAPAPGRVVFVHPDLFLTGQTIMIDHGYGLFSSYSHLSDIFVKLNQEVNSSDPIGLVGQTGRATGPHLHWTATWYGVRVNPMDLVSD